MKNLHWVSQISSDNILIFCDIKCLEQILQDLVYNKIYFRNPCICDLILINLPCKLSEGCTVNMIDLCRFFSKNCYLKSQNIA